MPRRGEEAHLGIFLGPAARLLRLVAVPAAFPVQFLVKVRGRHRPGHEVIHGNVGTEESLQEGIVEIDWESEDAGVVNAAKAKTKPTRGPPDTSVPYRQ